MPVKRNITAGGAGCGNQPFGAVFNAQGMTVGEKYPVPVKRPYIG